MYFPIQSLFLKRNHFLGNHSFLRLFFYFWKQSAFCIWTLTSQVRSLWVQLNSASLLSCTSLLSFITIIPGLYIFLAISYGHWRCTNILLASSLGIIWFQKTTNSICKLNGSSQLISLTRLIIRIYPLHCDLPHWTIAKPTYHGHAKPKVTNGCDSCYCNRQHQ